MLVGDHGPDDHMTIRLRSALVARMELLMVMNTVDGFVPTVLLFAKVKATGFQATQALVVG